MHDDRLDIKWLHTSIHCNFCIFTWWQSLGHYMWGGGGSHPNRMEPSQPPTTEATITMSPSRHIASQLGTMLMACANSQSYTVTCCLATQIGSMSKFGHSPNHRTAGVKWARSVKPHTFQPAICHSTPDFTHHTLCA